MDEFINWGNWWDKKYRHLIGEGVRYPSMKMALNIFHQRKGKVIVETGTTRAFNDFGGAGMATIFLGDYASMYDKHLWTVDILPEAIELSKGLTMEYADHVTYVTDDSLHFLTEFTEHIDFLYLDSYDYPIDENEAEALVSQTHQLNELKASEHALTDQSVIVLDDNAWENGGKCKLTKEYLLEKGWICLWDDFQSVWIRG